MRPPFVQDPTRYFPLKRAQNSTQYTLGRVLLQEAYVFADYDDSTFTVAQALFPTPASAVDIVEYTATDYIRPGKPKEDSNSDRELRKDAIAGLVMGFCVAVALLAAAALWIRRKRRLRSNTAGTPSDNDTVVHETAAKAGLDAECYSELGPSSPSINEMDARGRDRSELPRGRESYRTSELADNGLRSIKESETQGDSAELVGNTAERRVFELSS